MPRRDDVPDDRAPDRASALPDAQREAPRLPGPGFPDPFSTEADRIAGPDPTSGGGAPRSSGPPQGGLPELEASARRTTQAVASSAGVAHRFAPGRRASDVVLVYLRGDRRAALGAVARLAEALEDLDVEILKGGRDGPVYTLLLAITERLDAQGPRKAGDERRAKLRRRLRALAEADEAGGGGDGGEVVVEDLPGPPER